MDFLKSWVKEHRSFAVYFVISCIITLLDVAVSFTVEKCLTAFAGGVRNPALIGNGIGVVCGFIAQYVLCTKKIYAGSNMRTMVIFFLTWLVNIGLAEAIVYLIRTLLFHNADGLFYFLIGKGISIVIPFFVTYFLRKRFIPEKQSEN